MQCILREDQRVKNVNISVDIIEINALSPVHTALISWVLYNTTLDEPTSFDVKCSNEKHSIMMSVSGFTTQLMGLFPLISYNCCVSAVYELYRADGICDEIVTPVLFISTTTKDLIRASDSGINVVGGVLGFIVVILLALLIIAGIALAYLLVSRSKRNAIPGAR